MATALRITCTLIRRVRSSATRRTGDGVVRNRETGHRLRRPPARRQGRRTVGVLGAAPYPSTGDPTRSRLPALRRRGDPAILLRGRRLGVDAHRQPRRTRAFRHRALAGDGLPDRAARARRTRRERAERLDPCRLATSFSRPRAPRLRRSITLATLARRIDAVGWIAFEEAARSSGKTAGCSRMTTTWKSMPPSRPSFWSCPPSRRARGIHLSGGGRCRCAPGGFRS